MTWGVLLLTIAECPRSSASPGLFRSRTPARSWAECRGGTHRSPRWTIRSNNWARHQADPAVANLIAFTGGAGATNGGFIYIALKPLEDRNRAEITAACGPNEPPHASAFLQAAGDFASAAGKVTPLHFAVQSIIAGPVAVGPGL
jgi:hypothetical protein